MRMKVRLRLCGLAILLAALPGCGKPEPAAEVKRVEIPSQVPDLQLVALVPDSTAAGQAFSPQPNGSSALAVTCAGATRTTAVIFAGEKLTTVFGNPTWLTAAVPGRLLSKAGNYSIQLEDERGRSNSLTFEVK